MKANKIYYLLFVAPVAIANTSSDSFKFDTSVTSQLSDNAQKQVAAAEKVDERQDIFQVGASAAYTNEWLDLKGRYSLARQEYTENSQPDYTSLDGDLSLDLGASYQPAHLRISHSSDTLLNAPDAIDISSNRDERSILTAEPSLRWRLSDADRIESLIRASEIRYNKESSKDSSIQAVELAWMREVSKVDLLSLTAQSSKSSFDIDSSLDYRLDSALVSYSASLHRLKYDISLGANRVVQEARDMDFTRPSANVSLQYSTGRNSFNLGLNRRISDSSMGNAQLSRYEESGSATSGVGVDLIDLTSASIGWTTDAVCGNCVLNMSLARNREDYEVLLEDSIEYSFNTSFSYRIVRSGVATLSYWSAKRTFEDDSLRNDLSNKNIEIKYNYAFANQVSLEAFARKNERDSDYQFTSYNESVVGIKLAYSF